MPRLRGRARNIGRRTRNAQLVHDLRLNRTVEEHSMDNRNLRDQVARTRANENSEQRTQRLRANALRQREARQRATNAHRERNKRRMQDNRASLNRLAFEYDPEIDYSSHGLITIGSMDKAYQQYHAFKYKGPVEVFIKQEIKEEPNSPEGVFQQEAIEFEALDPEVVDASRSEETYRMQPWSLCSVKFEPEEESEEPQLSTSLIGDEEYPVLEVLEFKDEIKMNIEETEESEGPVEVFIKQEIKEEPEELEEVSLQEALGFEASQLEIAN